jgi:hypothetical protein
MMEYFINKIAHNKWETKISKKVILISKKTQINYTLYLFKTNLALIYNKIFHSFKLKEL